MVMMRKAARSADSRTRALCAELVRDSGGQSLQYRLLAPIARASGLGEAEVAVIDAVRRGWLIVEGEPPHSIALTDDGRRRVAIWLRRRRERVAAASRSMADKC
jgi:hypothetical protein